jgi:hypothetical protein
MALGVSTCHRQILWAPISKGSYMTLTPRWSTLTPRRQEALSIVLRVYCYRVMLSIEINSQIRVAQLRISI